MHFTKIEALRDLKDLENALCEVLDVNDSMEREIELELALEDVNDGIIAMHSHFEDVLTANLRIMTHEIVRRTNSVLNR
jgi:hypothetical protein